MLSLQWLFFGIDADKKAAAKNDFIWDFFLLVTICWAELRQCGFPQLAQFVLAPFPPLPNVSKGKVSRVWSNFPWRMQGWGLCNSLGVFSVTFDFRYSILSLNVRLAQNQFHIFQLTGFTCKVGGWCNFDNVVCLGNRYSYIIFWYT